MRRLSLGTGLSGLLLRLCAQGQSSDDLIDLMATAVDARGAKYPTEINSSQVHAMEGVSLC